MTIHQRGADALACTLRDAGVKQVFTVSGNHVMPVFDAALDCGIPLIHARHEAAAVHMADAWSRVSGAVGVALVTGGPGHANAVSALYTARMAEAPIVLLSGHAPLEQIGRGAFQEMAQVEMAAPVAKAAWMCRDANAVARDVAHALKMAQSGRPGPVHLSLPTDVLERSVDAQVATRKLAPAPATLDRSVADSTIEALRQARRPLVLVGPASMTRHGRRLTEALEASTGVPVVGMESPRGINDPCLGAFAQVLAMADCIVLVGKRLDFTLRFGQPPAIAADCRFLQIDAEANEFERSSRAVGERLVLTAPADAAAALRALAGTAAASGAGAATGAARHAAWRDDVRSAIAYRPAIWDQARSGRSDRLHPVQALRPLQALLDSHADAVLVSDGGEFGQWAQACLAAPHRVINGMAGAIGSALPYAIGARCAVPDAPVVATLGDGTFGFHAAEIDTAVRYTLPFVAIVGNDARWNAEYQIQLRDYGADRLIGCELLPTRYDSVCAGFGGHGEHVASADELPAAVTRACRSGRPACVNVMIEGLPAPQIRR